VTDVNTRADLSALKLAELQALASSLGISGASKLRKGDLVDAINENQDNTTEPVDGVQDRALDTPAEEATPQEPVAVRKRASRRVTSADTEAIAAASVGAGAPVVEPATEPGEAQRRGDRKSVV